MAVAGYKRTQKAGSLTVILMLAAAGFALAGWFVEPPLYIAALVLAVTTYLFSSLTVTVDDKAVGWFFGPGFWRKSVPLADIATVRAVRNKWWYGWGIRRTPHGWLYNVYSLDAVEISRRDRTRLRIGSSDPQGLAGAIEARIDGDPPGGGDQPSASFSA